MLGKVIKRVLFGPIPVAAALIGGGVAMIVLPRLLRLRPRVEGVEHVTARRALAIGLGQCGALWPGMSRSMCTILAAEATGLTTATAAEFSFLLALPTLGAATAYEALRSWRDLLAAVPPASMAIGLVTSFVVAWVVIAPSSARSAASGWRPSGSTASCSASWCSAACSAPAEPGRERRILLESGHARGARMDAHGGPGPHVVR